MITLKPQYLFFILGTNNGSTRPLDVISAIHMCLPIKSLLTFKCICKEWFNLIRDNLFIKLHHQKSLDNYAIKPSVVFLSDIYPTRRDSHPPGGTYNGLLCFFDFLSIDLDYFLICNPSTHAFKEISIPRWLRNPMGLGFTSKLLPRFGYDCENDDYKILVLITIFFREEMSIYSLKLNKGTNQPSSMVDSIVDPQDFSHLFAAFMNKRLHWIVENKKGYCEIARFNLCSERWDKPLSLLPIEIDG
ncbi:hypothetical protein Cgig2_003190 [Carnegiea gigantea]|uniref:F-box domain-containing protein n=1 Tax=Carnegiea gigantea TaxID=171969 RepID=A0A9Q1JK63_9CARY|nr:hypothetical protein Cgig2_003190 [Carnegiea gigantea]